MLLARFRVKAEEPVKPPERSTVLPSSVQVCCDPVSCIGNDSAADMVLEIPPLPSVTACPPSVYDPENGVPVVKLSEFSPNPVRSLVPSSHVAGRTQPLKKGKVRSRLEAP